MINKKEKNQGAEISVENLAKEIWKSLREEIVAVCTHDGNKITVRFPNGKTLLISVEENG